MCWCYDRFDKIVPKAKYLSNIKMLYMFTLALVMGLLQRLPVAQIAVICGMQFFLVGTSLVLIVLSLTAGFNPFIFRWELYSESLVMTSPFQLIGLNQMHVAGMALDVLSLGCHTLGKHPRPVKVESRSSFYIDKLRKSARLCNPGDRHGHQTDLLAILQRHGGHCA